MAMPRWDAFRGEIWGGFPILLRSHTQHACYDYAVPVAELLGVRTAPRAMRMIPLGVPERAEGGDNECESRLCIQTKARKDSDVWRGGG
jgi:hypothetical protein